MSRGHITKDVLIWKKYVQALDSFVGDKEEFYLKIAKPVPPRPQGSFSANPEEDGSYRKTQGHKSGPAAITCSGEEEAKK